MPLPQRPSMSAADWLLLVGLSLLWGGSFFFAKIAVLELPPLTVALGRVAIAAAILLTLARATGVALPASLPDWRPFALMGLLNNVLPFTLLFWGQTHIPSGLAAILNATTPLFTVLVAHVATADEKLNAARLAGLTAGLTGVTVMIGPDVLRDLGANVLAQLACLLAAISYAFAGVYGRRFRGEPALRVAAGQLTASSIILALPVALVDRPWMLSTPAVKGTTQTRSRIRRFRINRVPSVRTRPRRKRRWFAQYRPTRMKLSANAAALGSRFRSAASRSRSVSWMSLGTGRPSTSSVMAIAKTPSLRARNLPTS